MPTASVLVWFYDPLACFRGRFLFSPVFPTRPRTLRECGYTQNYDLAIVLLETSFEVFLQTRLIEAFAVRGIGKVPIQRRRGGKMVHKPVVPLIQEANIGNGNNPSTLFGLVDRLLGAGHIASMPEEPIWRQNAYDVRNRIVHKGERNFGERDAFNAGSAINAFITALNQQLPR
jgi:hypothetical protein